MNTPDTTKTWINTFGHIQSMQGDHGKCWIDHGHREFGSKTCNQEDLIVGKGFGKGSIGKGL